MSSGSVAVPAGEGVAPLNFIYACGVCCYSFADVYEGHSETVKGFSDGINPKDRLVTHLYLANCCHVFCGSHLEGGGTSRDRASAMWILSANTTKDQLSTPARSDPRRHAQSVSARRATARPESSTQSAAFRRASMIL